MHMYIYVYIYIYINIYIYIYIYNSDRSQKAIDKALETENKPLPSDLNVTNDDFLVDTEMEVDQDFDYSQTQTAEVLMDGKQELLSNVRCSNMRKPTCKNYLTISEVEKNNKSGYIYLFYNYVYYIF